MNIKLAKNKLNAMLNDFLEQIQMVLTKQQYETIKKKNQEKVDAILTELQSEDGQQQIFEDKKDQFGGCLQAQKREILESYQTLQKEIQELVESEVQNIDMILGDFKNKECSICLNKLLYNEFSVVKTASKCDHSYHPACLKSWTQNKKECPNCKQRIMEIVDNIV